MYNPLSNYGDFVFYWTIVSTPLFIYLTGA
jgi:hypothetical protein